MRILITGGAGCIGSGLTPTSHSAGHTIAVPESDYLKKDSLRGCHHREPLRVVRGGGRNGVDRDV